jgi:hypothetical protein
MEGNETLGGVGARTGTVAAELANGSTSDYSACARPVSQTPDCPCAGTRSEDCASRP